MRDKKVFAVLVIWLVVLSLLFYELHVQTEECMRIAPECPAISEQLAKHGFPIVSGDQGLIPDSLCGRFETIRTHSLDEFVQALQSHGIQLVKTKGSCGCHCLFYGSTQWGESMIIYDPSASSCGCT